MEDKRKGNPHPKIQAIVWRGYLKTHVGIVVLSLLLSGCSLTAISPAKWDLGEVERRLLLKAEEEQKLVEEGGVFYEDRKLEGYLRQLSKKLYHEETEENIEIEIRVIKDPGLNAFALPNGAIFIHSGLLTRLDNEAQLVSLLAHEMSHILQRHALRTVTLLQNHNQTLPFKKRGSGRSDEGTLFLTLVGTARSPAFPMSDFSQELEAEADKRGLEMMVEAGYDPAEALMLLEHLKREVEDQQIREPRFFGTHPMLEKRVESYRRYLEHLVAGKKQYLKNTRIFLENIRELIIVNAFLELSAGRYDAAVRGAEKVLRIDRDDPTGYYLLGEIFRKRGKPEDITRSKKYYERAISLNPFYPEPYRSRGLIHFKQGEWVSAKKYFQGYVSLSFNPRDKAYIQGYISKCEKLQPAQ